MFEVNSGTEWSFIECGATGLEEWLAGKGFVANGYFWSNLAEYALPEITGRVDVDPDANQIMVSGELGDVAAYVDALTSLAADRDLLSEKLDAALEVGVSFDD